MTTQEKIEVMQAYERGEQIQISNADKNEWGDIEDPSWNGVSECEFEDDPDE